jgi:hypothetical protein
VGPSCGATLKESEPVQKEQSKLAIGAAYAIATALLLATQSPLSFLAAKHLSVPEFIAVTEIVLLLCVPFMIRTLRSRQDFVALTTSVSSLRKFGVLPLIGLIGIVLYAIGLGRGHPIIIAAVLNLDPFWAAIVAYLVAGKKHADVVAVLRLLFDRGRRRSDAPRAQSNQRSIDVLADVQFRLPFRDGIGASGASPLGPKRFSRREMVLEL